MPPSTRLAPALALDSRMTVAVAGERAADLADRLTAAGAAPLTVESDHFALLSPDAEVPAVARVRDLPAGFADVVVLRRAWRSPAEIPAAFGAACAAVRSGGRVVATDLDVTRLLDGPSPLYPARVLYLAEPAAAVGLRQSATDITVLAAEAVRARLVDVEAFTYDEVLGDYPDVAALWTGIRSRGWRGAAWVESRAQNDLFERVADPLGGAVPAGPAVDREPWYAVSGWKR